ncbi:MAG: hypothetical protein ACR2LT_08720 [Pyrinomonadaceae bacterium]
MGFEEQFKAVMSRMVAVESDWKFVTSGGAALTVSTPIVHLGVNATGGALWVNVMLMLNHSL